MKISGEIQTTPLADLFQWIVHQQKTGCLSLTGNAGNHLVYFSQGKIAGTVTDLAAGDEGKTQAKRILQDVVNWKTGSFEFVLGPLPQKVVTTNLQMPMGLCFDKGTGTETPSPAPASPVGSNSPMPGRATGIQATPAAAMDIRALIVDRVLSGNFKIPLLPTVATRVLQITRRESYSLNDLSNVILTDQVIAANILKQANSSIFGGNRTVDTLPLAIQRIGSDTVTKLVLALSLQGIKSNKDIFLHKKKQLWEHSSACALFARFIALPLRLDHNLAFLCGLMQDFGKIVLLSIIQEVLTQGPAPRSLADESVEKFLAAYHPMIGGMVGEEWKLPAQVIVAMLSHHTLSVEGEKGKYAAIANLSDQIVLRLRGLKEEEIANLIAEELAVQPMAAELADTLANKMLGLSVEQLSTILAHAPECLKSAQELTSSS